MQNAYLELGQIVNTQGLKGFMKVNSFTDEITRFEELKTIYIEFKKELIEFEIEDVKYHKNQVLLKLKNVDTIEEAEKYRNCYIKIARKDAKKLPKDTFFIADLLGLDVYTDEDQKLGVLSDIYPTGSNDVYVVKEEETGKQILLPGIAEVIKKVDIENKKIVVHIIQGLL